MQEVPPSHLLLHVAQHFHATVTVLCCKVIVCVQTMAGLLPGMLWMAAGPCVYLESMFASQSDSHQLLAAQASNLGPPKAAFTNTTLR